MDKMLSEYNKSTKDFLTDEVCECLMRYSWPGNVRELKNITEFIVATVYGRKVRKKDLPNDLQIDCELNLSKDTSHNNIGDTSALNEDEAILKILYEHALYGRTLGRRKIKELLQNRGIYTTEDKIRTRMKMLEKRGLIKISKGRAGSTITEKGMEILEKQL